MTNPKLVIAQVSDNEFVAASTDAPFFCTVGESVEAVRARASQAAQFYQDAHCAPNPDCAAYHAAGGSRGAV